MILSNILKKVYQNLSKLKIPVAYGHFREDEEIHIPYIVFYCNRSIISADSDIYAYSYDITVEFYYQAKDYKLEDKFRAELYKIKPTIYYEQTIFKDYIMLKATFNLLDTLNENREES